MDRKLFSHTSCVSNRKARAGAVPVSMALHAGAIGAAIILSGVARARPADPPSPPPLTYRADPVPRHATVVARPPQRSRGGGARTPPRSAMPAPVRHAERALAPPTLPSMISADESIPTLDVPPQSMGANLAEACPECPTGVQRTGETGETVGLGTGSDGPLRVGSGTGGRIVAPRRIRGHPPIYPAMAIRVGLTGRVVIDCVIGPDGRVRDARVLSGHRVFHEEALAAVRQWQYTEPKLNGQPISVLLMVTVHFVIPR